MLKSCQVVGCLTLFFAKQCFRHEKSRFFELARLPWDVSDNKYLSRIAVLCHQRCICEDGCIEFAAFFGGQALVSPGPISEKKAEMRQSRDGGKNKNKRRR